MNKSRKSIVKAHRIDLGDDELLVTDEKVDLSTSKDNLKSDCNLHQTNPDNFDLDQQTIHHNNHDKVQGVDLMNSVTEKLVWSVSVSRPKFAVAHDDTEADALTSVITSSQKAPATSPVKPKCTNMVKTTKPTPLTNLNSRVMSESGGPNCINALLSPRIGLRNMRSLSSAQGTTPGKPRRQLTVEDEAGLVSINEYTVISNLGWGSYGSVKLVENHEGKQFALKIISKRKLMKSAGFFRRPPPLRNSSSISRNITNASRNSSLSGADHHQEPSKLANANFIVPNPWEPSMDRKSKITQSNSISNQNKITKSPPNQKRASKLLDHQSASLHTDPIQRIYQEIAIHKKLDHPNIVKLREVIDEPDAPNLFMIFDLIEGGPVMVVGEAEPFSEAEARKYFRDILLGLEYLHFNKIIHRDIKPSNLLLDKSGKVMLIDFGISCQFTGDDIFLQDTVGSPAFMAPEVVQEYSTKFTGKALDIWSLGVTLYCFLYGRLPFESHNKFDLYRMIATKNITFSDERTITAESRDLLTKMLTKNPKDRIKLPQIMTHQWVTENDKQPMNSLLNSKSNKYENRNRNNESQNDESNNDCEKQTDIGFTNNCTNGNNNNNKNPAIIKQIEVTDLEISQCTVRRLKIQTIVTAYQIARRRSFRKNDPPIT